MRKIIIFFVTATYLMGVGLEAAAEKKFQLHILGGISHVSKIGSEDDYAAGENDFPVTPSHSKVTFGGSIVYCLSERLAVELAGRYYGRSTVTLIDPSDQDTVEVKTAKHFSITGSFIYRLAGRNLKPYLLLGGGIDSLSAGDEIYTSEFGFEIEFLAPENKIDPLFNIGGGLHYYFSSASNVGLALDARYVIIFSKPDNVKSLNLMVGVFIEF